MALIDIAGHAVLRYMNGDIMKKYVDLNANEFAYKKR